VPDGGSGVRWPFGFHPGPPNAGNPRGARNIPCGFSNKGPWATKTPMGAAKRPRYQHTLLLDNLQTHTMGGNRGAHSHWALNKQRPKKLAICLRWPCRGQTGSAPKTLSGRANFVICSGLAEKRGVGGAGGIPFAIPGDHHLAQPRKKQPGVGPGGPAPGIGLRAELKKNNVQGGPDSHAGKTTKGIAQAQVRSARPPHGNWASQGAFEGREGGGIANKVFVRKKKKTAPGAGNGGRGRAGRKNDREANRARRLARARFGAVFDRGPCSRGEKAQAAPLPGRF